MGQRESDKVAVREAPGDGPIQSFLAAAAREHGLWLVGGTLPLRASDDARTCATPAWRSRRRATAWRATTRSTCSASTTARDRFDEARTIEAGGEPVAFTLRSREGREWRVGMSVCYDLRFPELYRTPRRRPAAGAQRLHLRHRPGALGDAAARARHREPGLRGRARAGRRARERPPHLGPQPGGRPLGPGAGRSGTRTAKAWWWPTWTPGAWPAGAASCPRWSTACYERGLAAGHGAAFVARIARAARTGPALVALGLAHRAGGDAAGHAGLAGRPLRGQPGADPTWSATPPKPSRRHPRRPHAQCAVPAGAAGGPALAGRLDARGAAAAARPPRAGARGMARLASWAWSPRPTRPTGRRCSPGSGAPTRTPTWRWPAPPRAA